VTTPRAHSRERSKDGSGFRRASYAASIASPLSEAAERPPLAYAPGEIRSSSGARLLPDHVIGDPADDVTPVTRYPSRFPALRSRTKAVTWSKLLRNLKSRRAWPDCRRGSLCGLADKQVQK